MSMNKYSRKRVKHLLIAATLVLTGILGLQACAKYEQVTDRLDFLKYEYFTCDVVSVMDGESFTCQTPDMDIKNQTDRDKRPRRERGGGKEILRIGSEERDPREG